jgi:hypothetical protein
MNYQLLLNCNKVHMTGPANYIETKVAFFSLHVWRTVCFWRDCLGPVGLLISSQPVGSASQLLIQCHPCNRFLPCISFSRSISPCRFDNGDKLVTWYCISFQQPDFLHDWTGGNTKHPPAIPDEWSSFLSLDQSPRPFNISGNLDRQKFG